MAEWSIASVLKTDEGNTSGGSNPSLSAETLTHRQRFLFSNRRGSLLTSLAGVRIPLSPPNADEQSAFFIIKPTRVTPHLLGGGSTPSLSAILIFKPLQASSLQGLEIFHIQIYIQIQTQPPLYQRLSRKCGLPSPYRGTSLFSSSTTRFLLSTTPSPISSKLGNRRVMELAINQHTLLREKLAQSTKNK